MMFIYIKKLSKIIKDLGGEKKEKMNKKERKIAVVVITGLLMLGVLTLATGIGSANLADPESLNYADPIAPPPIPFIPLEDLFRADQWLDFEHNHLPTVVANLEGTWLVTQEGFLLPANGSGPTFVQDECQIVIEQAGSLLGLTVEDGARDLDLIGSTVGDSVRLWEVGSTGWVIGTVVDDGDRILLHSNVQMKDEEDELLGTFVGTQVLERCKKPSLPN